MRSVSLKLEADFLRNVTEVMKKNGYATKTEFIREAIRDKIRELEKEKALLRLGKLYGASKKRTTDRELHKAGEKAFEEIEKEIK